jgi:DnaJ like chaperone protein
LAWWGKVIGGAFGFMLGGPLGGLIGAALGHSFDSGLGRIEQLGHESPFSNQERTQTAFFTATFSVMGHLAKADGRVTRDELRVANQLMQQMDLRPELVAVAQRLFGEGKAPDFPLNSVLDQFRAECHRNRNLIRLFLEIQVQAAYADGAVHPTERHVLQQICRRLGFSAAELDGIEARIAAELNFRRTFTGWGTPGPPRASLDDAYAILNIDPEASDAEVKKAYRRQMNQHHPDKLVAKGLPEEMMALATEKTQEIKLAYERIKDSRGL